jgi:dihydroorotase
LMLDHVNAGRLSLARFIDLTSAGPARLYNIACKGRIAAGYDADFTIVDLKRSETITDKWVASRAGWTPYDGMRVTGWPVGTFVRGRRVMWQGELLTPSGGEPVHARRDPITTGVCFANNVGHCVSTESATRYGSLLSQGRR